METLSIKIYETINGLLRNIKNSIQNALLPTLWLAVKIICGGILSLIAILGAFASIIALVTSDFHFDDFWANFLIKWNLIIEWVFRASEYIPWFILVILFFYLYGRGNKKDEQIRNLDETILSLNSVIRDEIKKNKINLRFEDIKTIRCRHVGYMPLTHYYPQQSRDPIGIGRELIKKIFEPLAKSPDDFQLEIDDEPTKWSLLLDNLDLNHDLVLTPLYQTQTRNYQALFSSPLYFAEIGIYVTRDLLQEHQKIPNSFYFNEALNYLRGLGENCKLIGIKGEISESMINKHFDDLPNSRKELKDGHLGYGQTVPWLVDSVMKVDGGSGVAFTEILQSERAESVKNGHVVNILKSRELLYPVCFAVARRNAHIVNFINLRLAEIDHTYCPNGLVGLLDEIANEDEEIKEYFGDDTCNEYFVRSKYTEATTPQYRPQERQ